MLGVASTRARLPLDQDNECAEPLPSVACLHVWNGRCNTTVTHYQWSIHKSANEKHCGYDRSLHLRIIGICRCVTPGTSSLDQDTGSAEPPPSSVSSGWLVLGVVTQLGSRRQCCRLELRDLPNLLDLQNTNSCREHTCASTSSPQDWTWSPSIRLLDLPSDRNWCLSLYKWRRTRTGPFAVTQIISVLARDLLQ